jgi:hypothetical protein
MRCSKEMAHFIRPLFAVIVKRMASLSGEFLAPLGSLHLLYTSEDGGLFRYRHSEEGRKLYELQGWSRIYKEHVGNFKEIKGGKSLSFHSEKVRDGVVLNYGKDIEFEADTMAGVGSVTVVPLKGEKSGFLRISVEFGRLPSVDLKRSSASVLAIDRVDRYEALFRELHACLKSGKQGKWK